MARRKNSGEVERKTSVGDLTGWLVESIKHRSLFGILPHTNENEAIVTTSNVAARKMGAYASVIALADIHDARLAALDIADANKYPQLIERFSYNKSDDGAFIAANVDPYQSIDKTLHNRRQAAIRKTLPPIINVKHDRTDSNDDVERIIDIGADLYGEGNFIGKEAMQSVYKALDHRVNAVRIASLVGSVNAQIGLVRSPVLTLGSLHVNRSGDNLACRYDDGEFLLNRAYVREWADLIGVVGMKTVLRNKSGKLMDGARLHNLQRAETSMVDVVMPSFRGAKA